MDVIVTLNTNLAQHGHSHTFLLVLSFPHWSVLGFEVTEAWHIFYFSLPFFWLLLMLLGCVESIFYIRSFSRWHYTESCIRIIIPSYKASIQWEEVFQGYCCHTSYSWFPGSNSWLLPLSLNFGHVIFFAYWLVLQGGLDDSGAASLRAIMHWQYRTICRGQNSILHNLYDVLGPKTHDYISFYGLRAYGRLFDGGPVATSQVFACRHSSF